MTDLEKFFYMMKYLQDPKRKKMGAKTSKFYEYEGPDTEPFEVYSRVSDDEVCIASINSYTSEPGKGRLDKIIKAARAVFPVVSFESVLNHRLRDRLLKEGFTMIGNPECPNMIKEL